jgi:hypothetical protein
MLTKDQYCEIYSLSLTGMLGDLNLNEKRTLTQKRAAT